MKKHPEATALTRENLMRAFWSLYAQKKIDHISIKEITDQAGYHRSTFYEYFVDIYDVLNQLEDDLLAKLKEKVIHSFKTDSNEILIQPLADLYETEGEYFSVLLGEKGDPSFAKKMKTEMSSTLMTRFGLSENDIHTPYLMEFGLSAIIATLTHWYQSNQNLTSKELIGFIQSMLMDGIFPMVQKYSTFPLIAGQN
jgi:AcrR family transcriptional regulator